LSLSTGKPMVGFGSRTAISDPLTIDQTWAT
jgi:hypothetical protein